MSNLDQKVVDVIRIQLTPSSLISLEISSFCCSGLAFFGSPEKAGSSFSASLFDVWNCRFARKTFRKGNGRTASLLAVDCNMLNRNRESLSSSFVL